MLMFSQLVTAMVLVWIRPAGVRSTHVGVGLTLLAVIWLSTFLLQVPQHKALLGGFDPEAYNRMKTDGRVDRPSVHDGRRLRD